MTKRLLGANPLTGEAVYWTYQPSDDSVTITHEQDVSPLLDRNIILANDDERTKQGIKGDLWHYATIPSVPAMKYLMETGIDVFAPGNDKEAFRMVNSPDYRYLKTTTKHHE